MWAERAIASRSIASRLHGALQRIALQVTRVYRKVGHAAAETMADSPLWNSLRFIMPRPIGRQGSSGRGGREPSGPWTGLGLKRGAPLFIAGRATLGLSRDG